MFEQSFKNIDQILHTDSGSAIGLDYVEQTSWILFLKYPDDLEETKKTEAALAGKKYKYILGEEYRWDTWGCSKTANGKLDHKNALDGDDLKDFVNDKLFPYLKKFRAEEPDTIEYKIGEVFHELKNKISTSFWSADGKPISIEEFMNNMFGAIPEYFSSEEGLRHRRI